MLSIEDIKKLTEYQKEVFVTKDDFEDFKGSFSKLQTSVDNIAKDVKDIKEDKVIMNSRMKNVENWVDKASPKLGLDFKH